MSSRQHFDRSFTKNDYDHGFTCEESLGKKCMYNTSKGNIWCSFKLKRIRAEKMQNVLFNYDMTESQ